MLAAPTDAWSVEAADAKWRAACKKGDATGIVLGLPYAQVIRSQWEASGSPESGMSAPVLKFSLRMRGGCLE